MHPPTQPDLFGAPPVILGDRDGETFEPDKDRARLNRQALAVFNLMIDGRWRTLAEISRATAHPEASVSARLRDLRKEKFGKFTVERSRRDRGLFEYRLSRKENY